MNASLHAVDRIRAQLNAVARLRGQTHNEGLSDAVAAIKRLQARRFRSTYADVLAHPQQGGAGRFFLDQLYGDHDFVDRDLQFGRVVGAMQRLFPASVTELAIDLTEIHALTETLDHTMAAHWLAIGDRAPDAQRYVRAWRLTAQRGARERQLDVVQHLGLQLQRMTRSKSLLTALKMMRRPAQAAGLSALQQFLEEGFTAFAALGDARPFLATIEARERRWMHQLFDHPLLSCATALDAELCVTDA